MSYRATLTLDYSEPRDNNEYSRLLKALQHAGWRYAETSAMHIETDDLKPITLGFELLARYVDKPGVLSACTVTIQLIGPDRDAPGDTTPENAYRTVMQTRLPSETG